MDDDFMLKNETAKKLFHEYAEDLPLIDYHCHISPREIYENKKYSNLTEVWLGGKNADGTYAGDHYKWRVMRSNGVPEEIVTGDADPYTRFLEFTKALQMCIGNPMYHWCHLELRKYFGINEPLTLDNAKEIWDKTMDMLQNDPSLTCRGIIEKSNVAFIGTTDDPLDSLEWHEKIAADPSISFQVRPSFRPDKAVNIEKDDFADYIKKLGDVVGRTLLTAKDVMDALCERIDYFKKFGCRASDHGLEYVPFRLGTPEEVETIFQKGLRNESLTTEEIDLYKTAVLLCLARKYRKENIVMEVHYSCSRNVNERMFNFAGPDTGFDIIKKSDCGEELYRLLSELDKTDELPKTILFSLDHSDFNLLGTMIGSFQSSEVPGKIQLGAAWWFLDSRDGMEEQMRAFGSLSLLGNFIGMLTDSRSFLSYTRHEYFRRILCNLIGQWVEDGEYPFIEENLKQIVQGVSFYNAKRYFDI